jgi:hypothetical protein
VNSKVAAPPNDEPTRGSRRDAGAVVEGPNRKPLARHDGRRGVEQGHRVQAAGNGQQDVAQWVECVAHGATDGVGLAHT